MPMNGGPMIAITLIANRDRIRGVTAPPHSGRKYRRDARDECHGGD
jgi:hypothetical protein